MKSKFAAFAALGVAAVVGVLAVLWFNAPGHRINEETAQQIRDDMTVEDLTELFGVPPGDYAGGRTLDMASTIWDTRWNQGEHVEWRSDSYYVRAYLRRDGSVSMTRGGVCFPLEASLYRRVTRCFGIP